MNWILISAVLIISLVGLAGALDYYGGVELRPGEAAAMERFEHGFGGPWVGGDPWPRGDPSHATSFGQSHPKFYSIFRPGFPFSGYWTQVHVRPFRACHPFWDCDGDQYYYSRKYFSGWRFQE